MFGGNRSSEYHRPHAAFLLPSLPNLFRSRKASAAAASSATTASPPGRGTALASWSREGDDGSQNRRSSYRYSVASASSAITSTSSQTPPSLSTSPSSYSSTSRGSLPASPIAVGSIPFPTIFGGADFSTDPSDHTYQPSFATTLTAEPDSADYHYSSELLSGTKPGPQAAPPNLPQRGATAPTAPPGRRLKRVLPSTLRCRRCSADLAFSAQIVSKGFTGRHGRAYLVSAPATCADHLYAPEVPARSAKDKAQDVSRDQNLVNIRVGRSEHRQLVTGSHVVADISCAVCGAKLGWKYVDARDAAQRYKVGKFILEIARLAMFHSWEDEENENENEGFARADGGGSGSGSGSGDDDGQYDVLAAGNATVFDPVSVVRSMMAKAQFPDGEGEATTHDEDPCAAIEFDSEDEDECEDIFAGTWDAEIVAKRRMEKQVALKSAE